MENNQDKKFISLNHFVLGSFYNGDGIKHQSPFANKRVGAYRRKLLWVFHRRDNRTCRMCGQAAHNVHHILCRREYPHWKKEEMNMISLCAGCHQYADDGIINIAELLERVPS